MVTVTPTEPITNGALKKTLRSVTCLADDQMIRFANVDLDVKDKALLQNLKSSVTVIDNRTYRLTEMYHGETWAVFFVLSLFSIAIPSFMNWCT